MWSLLNVWIIAFWGFKQTLYMYLWHLLIFHWISKSPFWINYTKFNIQDIVWKAFLLNSAPSKYPESVAFQLFTRNAYNIQNFGNPDLTKHHYAVKEAVSSTYFSKHTTQMQRYTLHAGLSHPPFVKSCTLPWTTHHT